MMIIRHALEQDRPRLLELMRAAHAAAEFDRVDGFTGFHCPWDLARVERCLSLHMTAPDALAQVIDVDGVAQGILLAAAFEHPFGPIRMAKDTCWWIEPAHRALKTANRSLDEYEAWAASLGVTYPGIAGMGDDPRIGRLLERRGYRVADTVWMMRLS
jgi:hypothetical protein